MKQEMCNCDRTIPNSSHPKEYCSYWKKRQGHDFVVVKGQFTGRIGTLKSLWHDKGGFIFQKCGGQPCGCKPRDGGWGTKMKNWCKHVLNTEVIKLPYDYMRPVNHDFLYNRLKNIVIKRACTRWYCHDAAICESCNRCDNHCCNVRSICLRGSCTNFAPKKGLCDYHFSGRNRIETTALCEVSGCYGTAVTQLMHCKKHKALITDSIACANDCGFSAKAETFADGSCLHTVLESEPVITCRCIKGCQYC